MPDSDTSIATSRSSFRHRLIAWFHLHQEKLWWLHSLYALALGVGFMWLGKRNFAFLRVAVFHIIFIWLSSLLLPKFLTHSRVPARWAPRLQLLVNFFNKNLYQQMLFFVLPIYYASATLWSRNTAFVALVALSPAVHCHGFRSSLVKPFDGVFPFNFFAGQRRCRSSGCCNTLTTRSRLCSSVF
jgi:hypothetical protein